MTDVNGITRATNSNSFGYYKFEEIAAGQAVILTGSAKHFEFAQPVQVVALNDNLMASISSRIKKTNTPPYSVGVLIVNRRGYGGY